MKDKVVVLMFFVIVFVIGCRIHLRNSMEYNVSKDSDVNIYIDSLIIDTVVEIDTLYRDTLFITK